MSQKAITQLSESDEAAALDTLTLAFSGDPAVRVLYPDASLYLKAFPGFARAFCLGAYGLGTAYAVDGMAGVACWLPPGTPANSEAIAAHVIETAPPEQLEQMAPTMAEIMAYHPHEPHWYLAMIGVDPGRQGEGLGGVLLEHMLARCDAEGMPAYLESSNPRNVPFYRRYGFEALGSIEIGGHPLMTPMLRPARG